MIHKLRSLMYKDFLLLVRDRAGLCMMYIMPMLLVVIMTYLQDTTFNSINETHIPLLLINNDSDSLGLTIEKQIEEAGIFDVSREWKGRKVGREELIEAVAKGRYMIGIVIPEKATENIRNNVRRYVAAAFNGTESSSLMDSVQVEIYIDPVTKSSFRTTLISALKEHAARTESDFMAKAIVTEVNRFFPISIPDIRISQNIISFKEQYALAKDSSTIPNSTQHNIPAWSIFAVFFIAISLSGNIIKEREDGSYTRLLTMPCPYYLYTLSKVLVYMAVCLLQYAAIFLMGIYLFPLLGLPPFILSGHLALTVIMGICSALAAIGYGIAIGKIAGTHQQAAIFASISTVIMAALGGIWIPVFVMPRLMKYASSLSPLNWGLEGFYDIFIRNGSILSIIPECLASVTFAILCLLVAKWVKS